MGCWNETCVLTRLPIFAGDKIVVLHAFEGVSCDTRDGGGYTPLVMGLPVLAEYDEYGGMKNPANPALVEMTEAALGNNRFFRRHVVSQSAGRSTTLYVAASAAAFFGLEYEIAPLFYHDCGVVDLRQDESGSDLAYKLAKKSLETLGEELASAILPETQLELDRAIMAMLVESFGADKAWPALYLLRKHFFPCFGQIFMHEPAYRAVIDHVGHQELQYHGEEGKVRVRDFISRELDDWSDRYRNFVADQLELAQELAETKPEAAARFGDQSRYDILAPLSNRLQPMASPWMASKAPLIGHFWGAVGLDEIFSKIPREDILDTLVFQWGRSYLRADFYKPGTGSQNAETELPRVIFERVCATLQERGVMGSDFYPYLHR